MINIFRNVKKYVQDSINYRQLTEEGIVEIEKGLYSKSLFFNDINYSIAKDEDKEAIFLKYCAFLNSFDPSLNLQITINNKNVSHEKEIMLPMKNDFLDKFREEHNKIMKIQLGKGRNDIAREKYITYTIKAANIDEARASFGRYDDKILSSLKSMGSTGYIMKGDDRLRVLHDFFNQDDEELLNPDIKEIIKQGITTKDVIAPDSMRFKYDHFEMGDKYARALFIKSFPSFLNDRLIAELTDFSINMMLTININPVAPEKALKLVKKQITGMTANKIQCQNRAWNSGYSQDILPTELQYSLEEASELLNDLLNKNQKMFIVNVLLVHTANSLNELKEDTKMIESSASKHLCQIKTLKYEQEDGLNSTLPLGKNILNKQRSLTSESTAVLIPFSSMELFQPGGLYYGLSSITRSIIFFNRKELNNPNAFILGTPGSGKSFASKREMVNIILSNGDDVILIDPESESTELVYQLEGEIIKVSNSSGRHINPFDMTVNYGDENDPLAKKAEFIIELIETIIGGKTGLSPKEKTIIDRVLTKVYMRYIQDFDTRFTPTLVDFYRELINQPEEEAKNMALSLERYAKGNFSIFSKQTNVNYNKRFISFDIKDLSDHLKKMGMVILLDNIWNRISRNKQLGRFTWLFIDEAHLLFKNKYAEDFLNSLYKRARKWNGVVTCITQNVSEVLESRNCKHMFSNSDAVFLFNQSATDRENLIELLKISDTQAGYITGSEAGSGLMVVNNSYVIPFKDDFPKDTRLYRMMTTRPNEVIKLMKELDSVI